MNIGTPVKLKSGGPLMTVDSPADNHNRVKCVWFDKTTLCAGSFNIESLKAVPQEEAQLSELF